MQKLVYGISVVDTPGLEESEEGKLEHRMMQQTMIENTNIGIVNFSLNFNVCF
jgi:predicted GTPase